jgi:chloride channel 3/4/5
VQDAAREQAKRKARRKQAAGLYDKGQPGWRYQLWRSYDAAQAWIVVTIIGVAIGLNAALLNIITEWLSDVKMGHCETGFYLNENFCCWGEGNGMWYPGCGDMVNADTGQAAISGTDGLALSPLTILSILSLQ